MAKVGKRISVTTYMEPIPKMKSRPSFCLSGICKTKIMGIGRTNSITSDAILQNAVAMYSAPELMQVPVVMETSNDFWTGLHAKIRLKKMPAE